jgi:hypothetical protein
MRNFSVESLKMLTTKEYISHSIEHFWLENIRVCIYLGSNQDLVYFTHINLHFW